MRRQSVLLVTLLALSAAGARAQAQFVSPVTDRVESHATPEAVVARVMSFDRNHDGKVMRDELPERMQNLLAGGDVGRDNAIDATEARKLANNPAPPNVIQGLQAGQYGFGDDEGFSTRLHIDGAIQDLRLADATRNEALDIGRTFADAVEAKASADLLTTMGQWLTESQMSDFKLVIERQLRGVALPGILSLQTIESVARSLAKNGVQVIEGRALLGTNLDQQIARYGLTPDQRTQAKAALEQFKATVRLNSEDRTALLRQMQALLNEQQRDDLRAALERRPIVKRGGGIIIKQGVSSVPPATSSAPPVFAISDLVLRR